MSLTYKYCFLKKGRHDCLFLLVTHLKTFAFFTFLLQQFLTISYLPGFSSVRMRWKKKIYIKNVTICEEWKALSNDTPPWAVTLSAHDSAWSRKSLVSESLLDSMYASIRGRLRTKVTHHLAYRCYWRLTMLTPFPMRVNAFFLALASSIWAARYPRRARVVYYALACYHT